MAIEVHFEKRIINNNVIREADAKSHRDYIVGIFDSAPEGTPGRGRKAARPASGSISTRLFQPLQRTAALARARPAHYHCGLDSAVTA